MNFTRLRWFRSVEKKSHHAIFSAEYLYDVALYRKLVIVKRVADKLVCFSRERKFIFFKDKDLSILESEINNEPGKVHLWLSANKLSVNIEKSHFVLFHPVQKQIPKKVMLLINNQSSTEEICIRYLGVYIDSNIIWKSHTNYSGWKKTKRCIGILPKLCYFLNTKTLLSLYYTSVEPFFSQLCNIYLHYKRRLDNNLFCKREKKENNKNYKLTFIFLFQNINSP